MFGLCHNCHMLHSCCWGEVAERSSKEKKCNFSKPQAETCPTLIRKQRSDYVIILGRDTTDIWPTSISIFVCVCVSLSLYHSLPVVLIKSHNAKWLRSTLGSGCGSMVYFPPQTLTEHEPW